MEIFNFDNKGNKIAGYLPKIIDSSINFNGENNILYCDENVCLNKSELNFNGCNSLIYFGTSEHKVNISVWNDSVCHCGKFVTYPTTTGFVLSEHKHIFMGDRCMISVNVMIHNSDHHLIYSCNDRNRINSTKSIYIGDHVWLGRQVSILKGTQIDSGSIIGWNSIVAGKKIPHNSIWAGNPARPIKNGVFWDRALIHDFSEEMTEASMNYNNFISQNRKDFQDDCWIYEYDKNQVIEWDSLETALSHGTAYDKCNFLINLNNTKSKNRFVHK